MPLSNKKHKPKTSQQKAQKAQMGIFARLVGCGWLIYIITQIIREDGMNPTLRLAVVIGFSCAAAFLGIASIVELVRNIKSGVYSASSYEDDPGAWSASGDAEPDEGASDEGEIETLDTRDDEE